MDIKIHVKTL